MPVVTSIVPSGIILPASSGRKSCYYERWVVAVRRLVKAGFIKTSEGLEQPNEVVWNTGYVIKQNKGLWVVLWGVAGTQEAVCGWRGDNWAWEESSEQACVSSMSLSPLNENGMQCSPHTPFSHCTELHCVPPCTPHLASKLQITTTEGGEDEWGWMNVPLPSPSLPPNLPRSPLPFLPSLTDCLPTCPSLLPHFAYLCFCRPVLWMWPVCITHISVSTTPLSGCPYKGLSFPKVRSEPWTQVLSRHLVWKKSGLLARPCPVSVYGGYDSCLGCPFPFLLLLLSFLC